MAKYKGQVDFLTSRRSYRLHGCRKPSLPGVTLVVRRPRCWVRFFRPAHDRLRLGDSNLEEFVLDRVFGEGLFTARPRRTLARLSQPRWS